MKMTTSAFAHFATWCWVTVLPAPNGPGMHACAALHEREEGVDDARAGHERLGGGDLAAVRPRDADRPALHHEQVDLGAVGRAQPSDRLLDGVGAAGDRDDLAAHAGRDHDPVLDHDVLGDGADDVAGLDRLAGLHGRRELPALLAVEAGRADAAREERAGLALERVERALHAVVDGLEHARAELDRERRAGGLDGIAGADALGLLVDLDRGAVAAHLDDLAHEALGADLHEVEHLGGAEALGDHERAGYLDDGTLLHTR